MILFKKLYLKKLLFEYICSFPLFVIIKRIPNSIVEKSGSLRNICVMS